VKDKAESALGLYRLVVNDAGNVGIGTTNPTHKLSFANVTGSKIDLWDDTTTPPSYGFGVEASELRIATTGFTSFYDGGYGGTELMRLNSTGLGIGTTSPSNNLHIKDTVAATVGLTLEGPSFISGIDHVATGLSIGHNSGLHKLYFQTASTTRMTIHEQGLVGIGTTSPAAKLHIDSATNTRIRLEDDGTTGFGGTEFYDGVTYNGLMGWDRTNDNLIFLTRNNSSVPKMVIENLGNVGIGTTSPVARLTVDLGNASNLTDELRVTGSGSESSLGVRNTSAGGRVYQILSTGTGSGLGAGSLMLYDLTAGGNAGHRLVVNSAGNVGIGTTTPGQKLDVEASGTTVAGFNRTTSDGTIVSLQRDAAEQGSISVSAGVVSYNAFTGSHYGWIDHPPDPGTLVTLTGDNRRLHDNGDSEIIYGVAPSSVPNDPKILGAYLSLQESQEPAGPDNPHLVMAVGNGEMWIVNDGHDIEIGDHLISSDVAGHAMRDTGEFPISHIVGIAVEAVDWDEVEESLDGRKHRRISVLFERFALNHAVQSVGNAGLEADLNADLNKVKAELSELRSEKEQLARSNDELRMQVNALAAAVNELKAMASMDVQVEVASR
jgi:hypothetical protein